MENLDISESKYEILQQFKRNVADILTPDHTDAQLLKWLKARNYSLKKAEFLLRGITDCKKVYDVENLVNTYVKPEVPSKYEYSSFVGFAKDGSLVRYISVGKGDHQGFIMSMSTYAIGFYCMYIMESDILALKKESMKTGRNVNEVTYIFDMEGFSIQQCLYKSVIELGLDLGQVVQEHYPEIWSNIFFVNAPSYFDKAFNIFKPMMRLSLLEKIRVVSRDSTASLLRKYIDEDVLPAFLGGKRVDSKGNPMCAEFIKFGGKIPEEYYLRNLTPLMPTDPGVTTTCVGARSVFVYPVVVRQAGSLIHVQIRSEGGSIGLKMLLREFGPDPEKLDLPSSDEYLDESDPKSNVRFVSPFVRIQAHLAPTDDVCKAPWPGIYIFRFDNTYSWFTSRKVIFRIQAIPPMIKT